MIGRDSMRRSAAVNLAATLRYRFNNPTTHSRGIPPTIQMPQGWCMCSTPPK